MLKALVREFRSAPRFRRRWAGRLKKRLAALVMCARHMSQRGRLTGCLVELLSRCLIATLRPLWRLRPALASAVVLAPLLCAGKAQAISLTPRTGAANPFNSIDVGIYSVPALADLDRDGDIDAVIGAQNGTIRYFRNTGTAQAPAFVEEAGAANLFDGFDAGSYVSPALADVDGDGDLDLVAGSAQGNLRFLMNTGSAEVPGFVEQLEGANPFNGIDIGRDSHPAMADLDGDGDLDAFIGEGYGTVRHFMNTGTSTAPVFSPQSGAANPFNGFDVGFAACPRFADLDRDGDLDAVIGSASGTIRYYRNTGTATAPILTEQTGAANPFNGIDVGSDSSIAFADLDGDGDLDLASGESGGGIRYYQDTASRFAAWQNQHFTLPAEADRAAPLADGEGDGLVNLVEYALRQPPRESGGTGLPPAQFNAAGQFQIVIAVRDDDPGLAVVAEVNDTPDLTPPAAVVNPVVSDPVPSDGMKTLTFTAPSGLPAAPQLFMRLKFTLGP